MYKPSQKRSYVKYKKRGAHSSSQAKSKPSTSGLSRSRRGPPPSGADSSESEDSSVTSSSSKSGSRTQQSQNSISLTEESRMEDNCVSSTSSQIQNRAEQSQCPVSSTEKSHLVSDCVFYLLVADQKKNSIKKPDIIKNVFKEHKKQYKDVMKKAELYLKQVFGIRLVELETPKGQYILVNEMKDSAPFIDIYKIEKMERMKLGFTMTVLAIIFMKEDFVPENDMWKALKNIGIDPDVKHPVFGDVKKLLTQELVKTLYVEYRRENSDPPSFVFAWGPRAKLEVSKKEVLQFVCDIYGENMTPEQWPNQHKDAMMSEEAAEEAAVEQ